MQPQRKPLDTAHADYRPGRWLLLRGSRVFTFPALSRESRRMHMCICTHTSHHTITRARSHLLHSPIRAADGQDEEVQAASDLHPGMFRSCTFCSWLVRLVWLRSCRGIELVLVTLQCGFSLMQLCVVSCCLRPCIVPSRSAAMTAGCCW